MKKTKNLVENPNKKSGQVSTRVGIERLFKILGFLQNGHIHHKPINCTQLREELGVDRATVMRDLAFLKDRMGVEFEWDAEEKGYRVYGDIKYLPSMELDDVDRLVLDYLEHTLSQLNESELGRAMQDSFHRMAAILCGKSVKNSLGAHAKFSQKATAGESDLKVYHTALRAMRTGKTLKIFRKMGSDNVGIGMEINPTRIAMENGKWVLDAIEVIGGSSISLTFNEVLRIEITKESAPRTSKLWSDPKISSTQCEFPEEQNLHHFCYIPLRAA